MGGIYVDFSVVNQLNSPALNSNTFANRPSAGQAGRLFISTDTFEIYRDNGTTWDLIGGPGTSTITGTGTAGTIPLFSAAQAIGDSDLRQLSSKALILNANTNDWPVTQFLNDAGRLLLTNNVSGNNPMFLAWSKVPYGSPDAVGSLVLGSVSALGSTTLAGFVLDGGTENNTDGSGFFRLRTTNAVGIETIAIETNGLQNTTFYGNIIRNGGLSTQFLKADGSLDSNTYLTSNIYTADGTLAAARTVNLNNHNLRFEGGANTARVRISANNNVARIFSFATADSARWALRVDGNETGSNAGANFELRRYNDAGSYVSSPIIVNRASGNVGIGGGLQQLETFNVTGSSLFSHSYTQGNDFNRKGVFAFLNTTTNAGAGFTNGYNYNALSGLHWDNFSASTTIPNGVTIGGTYSGAQVGFDTINTTVTLAQGSGGGLRTFSGVISQIGIAAPTTGGVVTHASGFQALAPYYIGANLPTITNYFGVAINDSTEYSSVAITNRWGIFQNGSTDRNYLNGNVLIGSAVDSGQKLQVTGTSLFTDLLRINKDGQSLLIFPTTTNSVRIQIQSTGGGNLVVGTDDATGGFLATGTNPYASVFSSGSIRDLVLGTNSIARLTINGINGNVGIGTNLPGQKLDVAGAIRVTDGVYQIFENSAFRGGLYPYNRVLGSGTDYNPSIISENDLFFAINGSPTKAMSLLANGNLLIGTTIDAGTRLHIVGSSPNSIMNVCARITANNAGFNIGEDGNNAALGVISSGTDMVFMSRVAGVYTRSMSIKSTGQVRFVPRTADPGGAEAGDVYYNSNTNKLRLYDGTNWVDLN